MFSNGNCASVPLVANIDGCGGNGNNGSWGDNGAWWIIIFVLFFAFGGWGRGGFGDGGNGGNTQFIPYQLGANYTDSAIARGFDNQAVVTKLDGITQGICDSTYALNNAITNGFNNTNMGMMQGFNGVERGFCNLSSQLANCCCDIERGIDGVNYNMAKNACDIQNTMHNNTRDIVESQNAGTRAILDFLTQDKIATLTAENQSLKFQASQTAQNAFITANQDAQTATLLRRLGAECPQPAYVVQPPQPVTFPTNCCGTVNYASGYGNGCGCSGCGNC